MEKNLKAMLSAFFARLDLVTREEFDIQRQVLLRTREKLERLEAKLAEIEQRERARTTPELAEIRTRRIPFAWYGLRYPPAPRVLCEVRIPIQRPDDSRKKLHFALAASFL